MSLSSGAPIALQFDAGAAHAGERYIVLGSINGRFPGTAIGALSVPLNPGRYLAYTERFLSGGLLQPPSGQLDALGRAAPLFVPWNTPSSGDLIGTTFHHVVIVIDSHHVPVLASNAVPITLVP